MLPSAKDVKREKTVRVKGVPVDTTFGSDSAERSFGLDPRLPDLSSSYGSE